MDAITQTATDERTNGVVVADRIGIGASQVNFECVGSLEAKQRFGRRSFKWDPEHMRLGQRHKPILSPHLRLASTR